MVPDPVRRRPTRRPILPPSRIGSSRTTAYTRNITRTSASAAASSCRPGRSTARNSNFGIVVNGSNNLPYPIGYGPSSNASQFLNPNIIGSHVLVESSNQNTDTINQFKLQGTWDDKQTKVRYGLQFTHDAME